ncbi:MAG: FAD-dependent oxidoreductase [Calothrix sp. C42_A2020_038]|nr:FAD-dependent oxidoreductase [Calothrix sp. C42_A2020_038]
MIDVAVIGAGMAGLVCARQLSQAGYSVLVIEKSRGFGGRVATRRLYGTCADHGACYLKPKGVFMTQLTELLVERNILQVWNGTFIEKTENIVSSMQPRYISSSGMSSIAKFLAQGLEVILNHRVIEVNLNSDQQWQLTLESSNEQIIALALVIAIPAPQALMLLKPLEGNFLGSTFINKLGSVEFFPSISVMAGYSPTSKPLPQWRAITLENNTVLGWIGFDSTKRHNPSQPVFVVQSSADFATANLEIETEDLQSVGLQILHTAANVIGFDWLAVPDWIQLHRWRYAFPRTPLQQPFLAAETPQPLICCGDWCGGNQIEAAIHSGLSTASAINSQLQRFGELKESDFLENLN